MMLPLVSSPSTTFLYNLDKQLISVTRPDGKNVTLSYEDPLLGRMGRLESIDIPRGTITQSFDPTTGNLSSILAPGGEGLAFVYDGSLITSTTWSGTVAGTVDQTYDDDFRIDSQTVDGSTVMFGYDDDGLLTGAGSMTFTPDPLNGLLTNTMLGVVDTAQAFNGFGELETDDAQVSTSSVYANTYIRDNLGRITEKTETIQGTTTVYDYHYEDAGRLRQVDETVGAVTTTRVYAYDSNGNRLSVTEGAVVTSGTYDAQDRLETYGTKSYTYSAAGDLETITDSAALPGEVPAQFVYDALGNLTHVTHPDGRQIDYVIDGQNRRVGKKVDGNLVQGWLYQDQLNPVVQIDESDGFAGLSLATDTVARFVYGSRPNVPDYMVKGGVTYRIISDHLGSPRLVIDESNSNPVTAVVQRLDYDEFGQVIADNNPGFQPFGFAGGIYDADTRLVRFGARDYDSQVGRWTAKDRIRFNAGDPNLFAYVLGDPVQLLDADGEFAVLAVAALAIVAAGAIGIGVPAAITALLPDSIVSDCDQARFNQAAAATAAVVGGTAAIPGAVGAAQQATPVAVAAALANGPTIVNGTIGAVQRAGVTTPLMTAGAQQASSTGGKLASGASNLLNPPTPAACGCQ